MILILCLYRIRPSKYLKMPYKLLHHTLGIKLKHHLIKNKERTFVFSRLRSLDELCYMDSIHKLWQTYYHIGVQHQLWPVNIMLLKINSPISTYCVIFHRIILRKWYRYMTIIQYNNLLMNKYFKCNIDLMFVIHNVFHKHLLVHRHSR